MALIIKNGLVFLGTTFEKKEILINDSGIIEKIGVNLRGEETVDAKNMLVCPGLIDPHVHLREPGQEYKEDFVSGSKAAIAGGITTLMDMPNNKIPTTTKERLLEKIERAKRAPATILFHFGGTDDNFEQVKKANPSSMKLYLGKTTGDLLLKNPKSMEKHFLNFDKEKPIVLHACDDSGNHSHDQKCLQNNVKEAVDLATKMQRRIHLAHVSTKDEIALIEKCKSATSEVAPHHLFLSKKDEEKLKFFAKVNPPLRSDEERNELLKSVQKINCIATDHAPHTIEDKEEGAAGFPGLETSLALMLDGANRGLFDRTWIIKAMSHNVADAFNLHERGKIEAGRIGDITIIDLKKEWVVDSSKMQSKCKWSPFENWKLKGKAEIVIRKGEIIYQEGEFS